MDRLPSWALPALIAAAQLAAWPGVALWLGQPVSLSAAIVAVVATALVAAALTWRRRAPLPALAGVAVALGAGEALTPDVTLLLLGLAEIAALYVVALRYRWPVLVGAITALVAWHALLGAVTGEVGDLRIVEYVMVAGGGHGRRTWLAGRRAAAERLARAEAERLRAAVVERQRLARELHDVSAHHLTSIVVTADAARRLADKRPELAADALEFAVQAGGETQESLRRLVAVMRTAEDDAVHRLDELVDGFARLGLDITLDAEPATDETVYGIVREALTNVLRYAPGSMVRISVADREVVVDNDASGTAPSGGSLGSGRGLAGARERAEAAGGTLSAGPRPGGGWRVRAVLLPDAAAPSRRRWDVQRVADAAIVVGLVVFPLLVAVATGVFDGVALVTGVIAVHTVPLLWRRRAPWAVLAAVAATAWVAVPASRHVPDDVAGLLLAGGVAEFVAVHAVATYGRKGWTSWLAVPVAAANLGAALPAGQVVAGVALGVLLAVVWGEAYVRRWRRDRVLTSEAVALARATDEAVAAAHDERLAIAAELRGAVLQQAARVVDVAKDGRLDAVADEARGALAAMRELLGSLRGPVDKVPS